MVTMANGLHNVFKIDKKYYFLHTVLNQIKSEGWQYLELSGRYSGFKTPNQLPSHDNQFVYFCHIIEKIKLKQIEEEYYKFSDLHTPTNGNGTKTSNESAIEEKKDSLMPPTPLNTLTEQAKALSP